MRLRAQCTRLAAAAFVAVLAAAVAADTFDDLAARNAQPEELAKTLSRVAGGLTRGEEKVRGRRLVFCSPDARTRQARAGQLDALLQRGVDLLTMAGFPGKDPSPDTTVVEVEPSGGFTGVVQSSDGRSILVRKGPETVADTPSYGSLPGLLQRADGPPIARDVVDAATQLRAELWRRAGKTGAGSTNLTDVLAARLEAWAVPQDAPSWLHVGLRAWLGARMAGDALPAAGHVCGGKAGPTIAGILDAGRVPPEGARGQLARLVDLLVSRGADIPAGVRSLGGGPVSDTAFTAAFGVPVADAQAYVFPATAGEASCVEGLLACPLCGGKGRLEIACPSCCGTGAVGCPSCFGSNACNAPGCIRGYHIYETGDKVRCGYCGGSGTAKCRACSGKGATPCKQCRRGVAAIACPACDHGKIPCPDSGAGAVLARACGEVPGTACPWCSTPKQETYCAGCGGAGYLGCFACFGTTKALCDSCGGSGAEIMVYSDGTKASSTKCGACSGKGHLRCDACDGGKKPCTCGGSGSQRMTAERCPMCGGSAKLLDVAASLAQRRERLAPPDAERSRAIRAAVDKGVEFLMRCRKGESFALVETRGGRKGQLMEPSLYSNATCIWTLAALGITKDDPRLAAPYRALATQSADLVSGNEDTTTQTVAEALRALVAAGAAPDDDVVEGLVKLLVKGQKGDGLWALTIQTDEDGSAFHGLFAIESLWLAQRRGVRVPRDTFTKALRAASKLCSRTAFAKDDYLTGTTVCSATALVVIAKAGSLGKDAGTFDYRGMKEVQEGLAWLDRYMDIRKEPTVSRGAYVRPDSQRGYAAYLYAIQRLSMLLSIEVLGGERWFATGALHLVDTQQKDGSWNEGTTRVLNGPVRTTTSALLFLARATPAVTEPSDD